MLAVQELCPFVILFVSMDPFARVLVANAMVPANTVSLLTPCENLSMLTMLHAICLISQASRVVLDGFL